MITYRGNTIMNGSTIELDGATFIECTYVGSTLIYSGGILPKFEKSTFKDCPIKYSGPADKREEFATYLNNSGQFEGCSMSW